MFDYTMGREPEYVYKSFSLAKGDEKNFDVILAKFDEHFILKRNIIHKRAFSSEESETRRVG